MDRIGIYVMPTAIVVIIVFGVLKRVPIFDTFLQGAKDGMKSTVNIAPALVGLVTAVTMLKASGALDMFTAFIKPITDYIGFPSELLPLAILRPVSGSGSIAILDNIMATYGSDSFIGRIGSVMMGSTETTFYAIAIYFGSVGVKNTRHTISASLISDLTSVIASVFAVILIFGRG